MTLCCKNHNSYDLEFWQVSMLFFESYYIEFMIKGKKVVLTWLVLIFFTFLGQKTPENHHFSG